MEVYSVTGTSRVTGYRRALAGRYGPITQRGRKRYVTISGIEKGIGFSINPKPKDTRNGEDH
jgi:hypothetical protein